jgi:hypothetical protein
MIDSSRNAQKSAIPGDPVVHVITAPNEPVARMWADILKQNNIHSLVKIDDLRAAMYVFYQSAFCRIYVLESQKDRAIELLTPYRSVTELSQPEETRRPVRVSPVYLCILILMTIIWLIMKG